MLIRDAVYGNVEVRTADRAVVAHPVVSRLRHVGQLGFAALVYPGAGHSRFSHSVGVMSVAERIANRLFDAAAEGGTVLPATERARFVRAARLAGLLHDIGHPPFSHTMEAFMPRPTPAAPRATHENYTLRLLTETDLADAVQAAGDGVTAGDVAAVLTGRTTDASRFVAAGVDWLPLLAQIASSELDADRLDYLLRDSLHAGVSYGKYDLDWLIANLQVCYHDAGGGRRAATALENRAVPAFEDFLLSRFHMYTAVYLHHRNRSFDRMLARLFDEEGFELPGEPAAYLAWDDHALWQHIRRSPSPWARRIDGLTPYVRLVEWDSDEPGIAEAADDVAARCEAEGIGVIVDAVESRLSRYFDAAGAPGAVGVFVRSALGDFHPIETVTPLFVRYARPIRLLRVLVDPARLADARVVARAVVGAAPAGALSYGSLH